MARTKKEREKRQRQRQRRALRKRGFSEYEVMKRVPPPGFKVVGVVSGIEKCLDRKLLSDHLADDNF